VSTGVSTDYYIVLTYMYHITNTDYVLTIATTTNTKNANTTHDYDCCYYHLLVLVLLLLTINYKL
jgi:hypothetical protein